MQVLAGPCCLQRPPGEGPSLPLPDSGGCKHSLVWGYITPVLALEGKVLAQCSAVSQEMGLDSDHCDSDDLLSVAGFIVSAGQGACNSQAPRHSLIG